MSKQFNGNDNSNLKEDPERIARKLLGYEDESLLRDLKEAEQELEQMKAQNPELEQRIEAEKGTGLEKLMDQVHAQNLKPVTEREYAEWKQAEERGITRLKPAFKAMLVAAAIIGLMAGMGIGVSAGKEFEYQRIKGGDRRNEIMLGDRQYEERIGESELAYHAIREMVGIPVIALKYKPEGMDFDNVFIDKGQARLIMNYGDKQVYLKEIRYPVDKTLLGISSDRKVIDEVENAWLGRKLEIYESKLQNGEIEYSTSFDSDSGEAYYYLSGIMSKEMFKDVIKNLYVIE